MKETYEEFCKKFEIKKTTDDCYTPDNIYSLVADYVARVYKLDSKNFVRPFYPGGDYKNYTYDQDCVVVDNPPFSIISQIAKFYSTNGIKFFIFAPTLTLFSIKADGCCRIGVGATITYENGAKVNTSFVTNLESENTARSAPELFQILTEENKKNERKRHRQQPKYAYPDNVVTATFLASMSRYGVDFKVSSCEAVGIGTLEAQRQVKKSIFGSALLCSEKVAAEKAAAEKAAEKAAAEKAKRIVWELSDKECSIIKSLGANHKK